MIMKFITYLMLAFLVMTMFACSSGKKSYKHGNYYSAVVQAIDRLRKNPDHKKSSEVLRKSYPMALNYYMARISNVQNSSERFKNGIIYDSYRDLNGLYENILRSPGALRVIPKPQNFTREAEEYRNRAAAERYEAGERALSLQNRIDAIDAYHHFLKAHEYVRGFRDVEDRLFEAREMATLKVLVEQLPVPTVKYQLSVEFFQEQVNELLFNYRENEFVRFYSPGDRNLQYPDQILQFRFDEFVVGEMHSYSNSREISKDSVVVGQVTLENGQKRDVIGTVKATFVENRQELVSNGLLTMRIIDPHTDRVLIHDKFPGEFVWITKWASYKGDERALTGEQVKLTTLKPIPPPPPQNLFIEFCRPIYSQLQNRVRTYYRNI
jgi:hypothetical protein